MPSFTILVPLCISIVEAARQATADVLDESSHASAEVLTLDLYTLNAASSFSRETYLSVGENFGDLQGIIKFLHTQRITESQLPEHRQARKDNVDSIAKLRIHVANTAKVLRSVFAMDHEFGALEYFHHGDNTNPTHWDTIHEKMGNWVGLQHQQDPRYMADHPISWVSLPGLPCETSPNGEHGCFWSADDEVKQVSIDELVGITKISCKGVPCKDYNDFRHHCDDESLKVGFSYDGSIAVRETCTEYDVHPSCLNSCFSAACLALMDAHDRIELGLPYWQGRCDAEASRYRLRSLASAFGFPPGVYVDAPALSKSCLPASGCRRPITGDGTGYCERVFSGTCSSCAIPMHKDTSGDGHLCTFDVWEKSSDYSGLKEFKPNCASRKARHLCCLYTRECDGCADGNCCPDPHTASLDEDGFELVKTCKDVTKVSTWLNRCLQDGGCYKPAGGAKLKADCDLERQFRVDWNVQPSHIRGMFESRLQSELHRLNESKCIEGSMQREAKTPESDAPCNAWVRGSKRRQKADRVRDGNVCKCEAAHLRRGRSEWDAAEVLRPGATKFGSHACTPTGQEDRRAGGIRKFHPEQNLGCRCHSVSESKCGEIVLGSMLRKSWQRDGAVICKCPDNGIPKNQFWKGQNGTCPGTTEFDPSRATPHACYCSGSGED